jgi:hypothetical protein
VTLVDLVRTAEPTTRVAPPHVELSATRVETVRSVGVRWPYAVAAVAAITYAGVGLWLVFGIDFAIGDALARSAAARSIVHSRDQHLMGVGIYWMPIPTFAQAPLMAVFSRFGVPLLALPLTTAIPGALTVLPLARAGRCLGLRERHTFLVVALYAFNPYTVFFAANGMSEAWTAFFLACVLHRYLEWTSRKRTRDLGKLGIYLALALLSKYEVLGCIPFIGMAVALQVPKGRRISTGLVVVLPALFSFVVWYLVSVVVTGHTPFEVVAGTQTGEVLTNDGWLPEARTPATSAAYTLRMLLLVCPAIFAAIVTSGAARDVQRALRALVGRAAAGVEATPPLNALGVALPFLVFPGQVALLLLAGTTFGNPRYYTPVILAIAFLSLVSVARARTSWRPFVLTGLAVVTIIGYGTAFATMSNPSASKIEGEHYVIDRLLGREPTVDRGSTLRDFASFTAAFDAQLVDGDLVAVDSATAHPVALLTEHPRQVATDRDKDSERLSARNPTLFTWIVYVEGVGYDSPFNAALGQIIQRPPTGMQWVLAAEGPRAGEWPFGDVNLYHLVPADGTTTASPQQSTTP